ncbi:acyltransferase [Proteus mirabilis]|uniref:acyltransferase n=2 Tax=Proteus TaxID=583 RepID=UPI00235F1939|nr:acyltransferase [Proteus mirabilis]MDC9736342.1 acyltransferase [Proteus mirabilis]MDC9775522.1 acyltransferase [Proteus mirabilis]MDC9782477.1 acyltransferase [Proteus mirabilis]
MTGRNFFKYFGKFISLISFLLSVFPKKFNLFLFNLFSGCPTYFGTLIRYILLKSIIKDLGNNVYIGRWCIIKNINNLTIGNNVSIHDMCYIDALGGIKIGNNVSIAHQCSLISFEHNYNDEQTIPIKYQRIIKKNIILHDNIWIGCGSRILAGTIIPQKTVIAANTVTKGELKQGVNAGSPARKIKDIL